MIVLKISGSHLDKPTFVNELVETVVAYSEPFVIVHGGGREISQMQQLLGIEPEYVDGLRVSDPAALTVAEMVLCGSVNTRLVAALQLGGIEAQGLSGVDRGLIRARKLIHPQGDLGRVGEPYAVRSEILIDLLNAGVTPVIAPICLGDDGSYNVNADHVAGAVAKAISAEKVIFLTNVQGVLHNNEVIDELTPHEADLLITTGVIIEGMIPKVRTAQQLVASGVAQVVITNLVGVLTGDGTAVVAEKTLP